MEEQVLAIWEDDTQGTKEFGGSIKIPLINATTTYNISVSTQDEIIRNWKVDRVFVTTFGNSDQGHGFKDSWPIYDGNLNVSYTLPLQCY